MAITAHGLPSVLSLEIADDGDICRLLLFLFAFLVYSSVKIRLL